MEVPEVAKQSPEVAKSKGNGHLRTGSLSGLDVLLDTEEQKKEREASSAEAGSSNPPVTPQKIYSNDELSEISPRSKSVRSREARNRSRVSLERYSTSILEKPLPTRLETKLDPIAGSARDLAEEEEPKSGSAVSGFENYVTSEFGLVKPISEQEGILDLDERERVYNTLIYVPLQYERMLLFGLLLCLDSFLSVFTLVPVRAAYVGYRSICSWRQEDSANIFSLLRRAVRMAEEGRRGNLTGGSRKNTKGSKEREAKGGNDAGDLTQALPDYLCDVLWLSLIFLSCYVLLQWKTSEAFHYIHAQEVIKLYVVLTMLEIFDKICGSLSFDCLETLAASCSMLLGGRSSRGGQGYPARRGAREDGLRVLVDFFVTLLVMCLHCLIIMLEAVAFNVVLNSASSSLLALLVSNNFAELKGTVFKNMNVTRLWTLSMQDIVEHFHITVCLLFVLIENMLLTNASLPSYQLAGQCAMVLGTEIVVDIMKHAFVGKFQNLKPGVYSEYLKDMCEKTVASSSINGYRIVKFNPLVPASILLRIVIPLLGRYWRGCASTIGKLTFVAGALCFWIMLFCVKLALGWCLQRVSRRYLEYYSTTRKTKAKPWLLSSRKPNEKCN